MTGVQAATRSIRATATVGVVVRPFRWPETVWAVSGAALLVLTGLLAPEAAGRAVGKRLDVYLFLAGMMLLSETARANGSFALPSLAAIIVTYLALRLVERLRIAGSCETDPERQELSLQGEIASGGIASAPRSSLAASPLFRPAHGEPVGQAE